MEAHCKVAIFYTREDGTQPFKEWLTSVKDQKIRDAVESRITRLQLGNYGDYKSLGAGLLELRFLGLGIRVYFAEVDNVLVLLLWGGGKNTPKDQARDIAKARDYLEEFKRALQEGEQHD